MLTLTLHLIREPGDEHLALARVQDSDLRVELELTAGQAREVLLEFGRGLAAA